MKERCGLQSKKSDVYEQMMPASMKQDEKHLDDMICYNNNYMIHPFTTSSSWQLCTYFFFFFFNFTFTIFQCIYQYTALGPDVYFFLRWN